MSQEKGEYLHSSNPKKRRYVYLDKFEAFKLSVEKWQVANGKKKNKSDLIPLILSAIATAIACVALWYAAHS